MPLIANTNNKSTLVQIMNEVDELSSDEKDFLLYWIRAKKNASRATESNESIVPNNLTLDDIYAERNAMRNENKAK